MPRHARPSWRERENSRRDSRQNAISGAGLTARAPRSPAGLSRLVPRTLRAGLPVLEAHRGADRLTTGHRPTSTPSIIRPCPAGQHPRTHRPRRRRIPRPRTAARRSPRSRPNQTGRRTRGRPPSSSPHQATATRRCSAVPGRQGAGPPAAAPAGLQADRSRPSAAQGFCAAIHSGQRPIHSRRAAAQRRRRRPGSQRRFLGLRRLRKQRRRQGNCGIETAPGPHQLDSYTRRRSTAPTAPCLALFYFPAAAPDLPRASVARSHARSRIICVIRNAPPADGRMHRCAFRITCDYTE